MTTDILRLKPTEQNKIEMEEGGESQAMIVGRGEGKK